MLCSSEVANIHTKQETIVVIWLMLMVLHSSFTQTGISSTQIKMLLNLFPSLIFLFFWGGGGLFLFLIAYFTFWKVGGKQLSQAETPH